ncbi:unnamed protein product [Arctogadus glacialis]
MPVCVSGLAPAARSPWRLQLLGPLAAPKGPLPVSIALSLRLAGGFYWMLNQCRQLTALRNFCSGCF